MLGSCWAPFSEIRGAERRKRAWFPPSFPSATLKVMLGPDPAEQEPGGNTSSKSAQEQDKVRALSLWASCLRQTCCSPEAPCGGLHLSRPRSPLLSPVEVSGCCFTHLCREAGPQGCGVQRVVVMTIHFPVCRLLCSRPCFLMSCPPGHAEKTVLKKKRVHVGSWVMGAKVGGGGNVPKATSLPRGLRGTHCATGSGMP